MLATNKLDKRPLGPSDDPRKFVAAAEWNESASDVNELMKTARNVADIAARDAIDSSDLEVGLTCYTRSEAKLFRLASLGPPVWVEEATLVESVVGTEAIPAGALIKASATAGRYSLWHFADSPLLIIGAAVTDCSGSAAIFLGQFVSGTTTTLLSDGTATIPAGSPVVASSTVNGRVKAGLITDPSFLGFNVGDLVGASLDSPVSVR